MRPEYCVSEGPAEARGRAFHMQHSEPIVFFSFSYNYSILSLLSLFRSSRREFNGSLLRLMRGSA